MTGDEAKTVAALAAQCLTWSGWRRWGLIMRYGRVFTPGTDTGSSEGPEPAAGQHAEVHLNWETGPQAGWSFAVLHRLDYNVWDARLHPAHQEGGITGEEPPVRLTRNGVSYKMALAAIFRAMGDETPEQFIVV